MDLRGVGWAGWLLAAAVGVALPPPAVAQEQKPPPTREEPRVDARMLADLEVLRDLELLRQLDLLRQLEAAGEGPRPRGASTDGRGKP